LPPESLRTLAISLELEIKFGTPLLPLRRSFGNENSTGRDSCDFFPNGDLVARRFPFGSAATRDNAKSFDVVEALPTLADRLLVVHESSLRVLESTDGGQSFSALRLDLD
jgi:hypothetical protein